MNKNNSNVNGLKNASVLSREKCSKIMAGLVKELPTIPEEGGPSGSAAGGSGGSGQTTCGVAPPIDDPLYPLWVQCMWDRAHPLQAGYCVLP
ncbi:hypothetical protein GCM10023210_20710 [Chryseobacterium ginsengisoli]|uniref:Uncharacterized protein n=1 Tax=Chryseobacterium ginsengisoli TaxID=363853 RepID=A0ABP9M713_9FLAO